jgi:hypothetical protein
MQIPVDCFSIATPRHVSCLVLRVVAAALHAMPQPGRDRDSVGGLRGSFMGAVTLCVYPGAADHSQPRVRIQPGRRSSRTPLAL